MTWGHWEIMSNRWILWNPRLNFCARLPNHIKIWWPISAVNWTAVIHVDLHPYSLAFHIVGRSHMGGIVALYRKWETNRFKATQVTTVYWYLLIDMEFVLHDCFTRTSHHHFILNSSTIYFFLKSTSSMLSAASNFFVFFASFVRLLSSASNRSCSSL